MLYFSSPPRTQHLNNIQDVIIRDYVAIVELPSNAQPSMPFLKIFNKLLIVECRCHQITFSRYL